MTPVTNSELACFQRCEREWQHRYLDHREGLQLAETLSRGKRMHAALAGWWINGGLYEGHDYPAIERAMLLGYHARYDRPHLRDVRVNVPFRTTIGGVEMVGECDAVGIDPSTGDAVVVEHKTTSHDVTPGSAWWRERVHCDSQPSTYLAAFPGATVCYDVLHVPAMKPLPANSKRKEPEGDEEYIARVLADMADKPEKYFQRAVVVRLDSEREAFDVDVDLVRTKMTEAADLELTPRNPRACFQYGRACDFLEVCWQGRSLESLPLVEKNHSEEMLSRYEASFQEVAQ